MRIDYRKILFENWGIKLISFCLSLFLWFYVTSTGKTEMSLTVPVELQNVPPSKTIVGNVTGSVDVRVQGQERVLRDPAIGKRVACVIDLSKGREGENAITISPDDIKRPAGMTVSHVSEREIRVRLEQLIRKSFSLKPVLQGVPAAGYRLAGTDVMPMRITAEGPESIMKSMTALKTLPVDIEGARETFIVEPKIDYQGRPIKLLDKNITMRIIIERTRR